MRVPQPSRRHAPPEVRRAQILEAALTVFGQRGYHAATMDDLVTASGLSKGSLYWHFGSKEAVFLALFDEFAAAAFQAFDQVGQGAAPLDAIRRGFGDLMEQLLAQGPMLPAWMEFLAHPAARERFASVYAQTRARLAELLSEAITRGEVRSDLEPESMATAFVAATEGLLLQSLVDPDFDVRAHESTLWEGLIGGFGT